MPTRVNSFMDWDRKGVFRTRTDKETGETIHEVLTREESTAEWDERFTFPDKQLYDVCYYRSNPLGMHREPFEPHVTAVPSESHRAERPHRCHIGVDICARVIANTEEEALEEFWNQYHTTDSVFLD